MYVGLRGTHDNDIKDMERDLSLLPTGVNDAHMLLGMFHSAQQVSLKLLLEFVAQESVRSVVIMGHSHGGTVAQALLFYLLTNPLGVDERVIRSKMQCVSFGSPFLGDHSFAELVRNRGWGSLLHTVLNYVS